MFRFHCDEREEQGSCGKLVYNCVLSSVMKNHLTRKTSSPVLLLFLIQLVLVLVLLLPPVLIFNGHNTLNSIMPINNEINNYIVSRRNGVISYS